MCISTELIKYVKHVKYIYIYIYIGMIIIIRWQKDDTFFAFGWT